MPAPALVAALGKRLIKRQARKAASNRSGRGGGKTIATIAVVVVLGMMALLLSVGAVMGGILGSLSGDADGSGADACIGTNPSGSGNGATAGGPIEGIPPTALDAYRRAGQASGVDWTYIAALGSVESDHGRYNGATMAANGDITPRIIGLPLNGTNGNRAIRDTDLGLYDGDTVWDRAVGPMQFIPSTWIASGKDGNNDGKNDPHNYYDAIMAAAFYLKAHGAPANMRQAIFAYNRADWYVNKVMDKAEEYRGLSGSTGAASAPAPDVTSYNQPATPALAANSTAGAWVQPLAAGSYTLTSRFGTRSDPINGNGAFHNGLDYAAPAGTAVMAIGPGTVTTAGFNNGGYGNWVKIDHGNGVISLYAHMYATPDVTVGQQVTAAQKIGGVGTTGRSTGNHLHFTIYVQGVEVDPETFMSGASSAPMPVTAGGSTACGGSSQDVVGVPANGGEAPWGGFSNGRIPADQLCAVAFAPNHRLRCDAARAIEQLNTSYASAFGHNMVITDSYRSYEAQVICRQNKGSLCAVPGTSNHGWGMAVDLGDGVNLFSSPTHQWLKANAANFGWVHPPWAQQGGSKPEAWHWEFGSIS